MGNHQLTKLTSIGGGISTHCNKLEVQSVVFCCLWMPCEFDMWQKIMLKPQHATVNCQSRETICSLCT